jgi:D-hydroxyproline dehydrogenase subunit gamma
MPEIISVTVNGASVRVPRGATTLAAVFAAGGFSVRRSVSGTARGPLCGMGVCFECRATVNHRRYARTCQILCTPGMDIRTND